MASPRSPRYAQHSPVNRSYELADPKTGGEQFVRRETGKE